MKQLSSSRDLDSVFAEKTALLYKHSTRCPISAAAHQQLESFLERNPEAPLYMVDVNASEEVSHYVVEKTGIEHESPQLILLRSGTPIWTTSHFDITADAVAEQLGTIEA